MSSPRVSGAVSLLNLDPVGPEVLDPVGSTVASVATAGSFAGLINLTDAAVGAVEGLALVNLTVNPGKTCLACARGGSAISDAVSSILALVLVTASGLITIGAFPPAQTRTR